MLHDGTGINRIIDLLLNVSQCKLTDGKAGFFQEVSKHRG